MVIINCARGGIVNEADLLQALDSGKVSAAAIDVYSSEPPTDFALAKHANVKIARVGIYCYIHISSSFLAM